MAVYQVILNGLSAGKSLKGIEKLRQQGVELKLCTTTAFGYIQVDYADIIAEIDYPGARVNRGTRIDVDMMSLPAQIPCKFPHINAHAAGIT